MEYDIINTINGHEVIGSTYADIYLKYDNFQLKTTTEGTVKNDKSVFQIDTSEDTWKSPSDLLTGIIHLKPPFTSKITKSKTHEGILKIGDDVLQKEHQIFLTTLKNLLRENDDSWKFILKKEKEEIQKKVKIKYQNIFKVKSKLVNKEIELFYENSLQELEEHIKNEVQTVLVSVHANMVSYLNNQIHSKLQKERKNLEETLNKNYVSEVKKIKKYYTLLLKHEYERVNKLVNNALNERNNAINTFYKQILCERLTSTIYVMCTERKKCKIKKILLEKYHNKVISDVIEKIKEKRNTLQSFMKKDVTISYTNIDWENKIKKILQLFLKFISFSLKLLPEQTTFLLHLEKMVHLQLEEIKTSDRSKSSVLFEEDNIFHFDQPESSHSTCNKEPFIIEGDFSVTPPRIYGSRETLPFDVDLPFFKLQRQFIYAKCHGFENIKKFLESQRCKCRIPSKTQSEMKTPTIKSESTQSIKTKSSDELLLFENINRLIDCPVRKCNDITNSFPYLNSYLDFSEEKFKTVEAILGSPSQKQTLPNFLDAKRIAHCDVPFSETREKYHTVETQYSSTEDVRLDHPCLCVQQVLKVKTGNEAIDNFATKSPGDICIKRSKMLKDIAKKYPKLIKIFAEHDIYSI